MKITYFVFAISLMLSVSSYADQHGGHTLTAQIIGSGSPQFNPDRAGPGVLISDGHTNVLIDTGNGTQAHLATLGIKIKQLDGLFYTHHHLDHNEEFIPIFIRSLLGGNPFQLVGPPPMSKMNESVLGLYKTDIEYRMRRSGRTLKDVADNYSLREISDKDEFTIGGIKVSTTSVKHTIDTIAYRFDVDGYSVVISGDLSYSASLSELAKNADVLIIDSGGTIKKGGQKKRKKSNGTKSDSGETRRNSHQRAHVTLDETAKMASDANVKKIVLTHFTNGENDEGATTAKLREGGYTGDIVFAIDLMVVSAKASSNVSNVVKRGAVSKNNRHTSFTNRPVNPCTVTPDEMNLVQISEQNSVRTIKTNAIPNHKIGTFPNQGNPNRLSAQDKTYQVTLLPQVTKSLTYLYDRGIDHGQPNYLWGVALNGIKIEPVANEYFHGENGPNYDWTVEALSEKVFLGDDCNNAHIQPNGEYHYHGSPTGLVDVLMNRQADESMVLTAWAADGFPIYYARGYEQSDDSSSTLVELKSSYRLREGQRPGDGQTAPDGVYDGLYVRDYEYVVGFGDLDQCNGRFGVTPEFPNGTYYYVLSNTFPFAGRCLRGEPSQDFKVGGSHRRNPVQSNGTNGRLGPSELMQRMDRNTDGRIAESEARGRLKDNFDRRDRNSDGFITLEELSPRR